MLQGIFLYLDLETSHLFPPSQGWVGSGFPDYTWQSNLEVNGKNPPLELLLNHSLFLAQDSSASSPAWRRDYMWRSPRPARPWWSGRSHRRSPRRSTAPACRRRLVPHHIQNSLQRNSTWPARYDPAHAIRAEVPVWHLRFYSVHDNDLHIISNPEKKKGILLKSHFVLFSLQF